jgi:hypothetical protein
MQTSSPSINNNQAFSNDYSQTSLEITPEQMLANGVSHEGLEIHDHFGPDAAKVLNDYACQVEDALIQTNAQLVEACNLLQELSGEHRAYEQILTDPDTLADYTCEFFGENGPYPIPEELLSKWLLSVLRCLFLPSLRLPPTPATSGTASATWPTATPLTLGAI